MEMNTLGANIIPRTIPIPLAGVLSTAKLSHGMAWVLFGLEGSIDDRNVRQISDVQGEVSDPLIALGCVKANFVSLRESTP